MASTRLCIIFIAVIATFATLASAKEFVVGDDKGWTLGVDYQAWAAGKEFMVGDTLVFKYGKSAHNVYKVNGTVFADCSKPLLGDPLTTGNDVITLATPGRKWYVCGVGKHCEAGMKLFITVGSQAPAPSPTISAAPASTYHGRIVAAFFGVIFFFFLAMV